MSAIEGTSSIRVLIVDDHPMLREGTAALLVGQPDLTVVGTTGRGVEALELIASLRPDVLILDLQLPDLSGVEVARRSRGVASPPAILVLSNYEEPGYVRALLQIGARGYLGKATGGAEIVAAVRAVAQGQTALSPKARAALGIVTELTARETDVLQLLAIGRRNNEVAAELLVSENTVEYHVRNILQKLQARSRMDAVHRAREQGLVQPAAAEE